MISALLLLLWLLQKLQKGAVDREFRQWPEPTLNLAKKGSQLHPLGQSSSPKCRVLCTDMPVSLLSPCLCPSFPANLLGSIRRFQVALKGLWEAVPGIPRLWGRLCPQCLISGAPTTSTVTGPVVEPSLFLYPLAFLCALAAPRCLQALPRLLPPGYCLISAPIPVSSPLPLEMLPGGTSHLVCSLFLARAVA